MRELLVQLERERLGEDIERMSLGRQPKKAGRVWRNFEEERDKLRATLVLIEQRDPESLRTCVQRVALFWRLLNGSRGMRRQFLRPLDLASPFPQWGWSADEQVPTNPRRGDVWRAKGATGFRVWNGKRWVTWTTKTRHLVRAEDRALATCYGYAAVSDFRCARVWLRLLQLAAETLRDELVLVADKVALPYDDTAHHALVALLEKQRFKAERDEAEQQERKRLDGLAEQELLRLIDRGARGEGRSRRKWSDVPSHLQSTLRAVLTRFQKRDKFSSGELPASLKLHARTFGRHLDELAAKGWIKKDGPDANGVQPRSPYCWLACPEGMPEDEQCRDAT